MPHSNIITANSEQEIWNRIAEQIQGKKDNKDYTAQTTIEDVTINVDIDFHPESAEEGNANGTTSFSAPLPDVKDFRFRLFKQNFKHNIRKLFGMQDVVVGNDELDQKFIIQSNDEQKVKTILANEQVSSWLLQLPVYVFEIRDLKIGANREVELTLEIEGRIKEPETLKNIFQPFKAALPFLQ